MSKFSPMVISVETVGVAPWLTLEQMYPVTAKPLGVLRDPMASHDEKLRAHEWLTEYGFGGYLRPIDDPRAAYPVHGTDDTIEDVRRGLNAVGSPVFGTGGSVGGSGTRGGNASSSHIADGFIHGNVTVTRWLRGIQDQMWPTGGDHLIEAINAAERTGETPGSTAYSRAALCSLPGVTSAVLHDCSTIKAMRPGEVAAVVGGGDPESIARVLRGTMRAGIVMLGTERSGGDERWFTPETERELHTLLWLRGIASQGPTIDPLDDEIDGAPLRSLLLSDEAARHDRNILAQSHRTPDQRAAVAAHWSAQLRAKVAASAKADAERERNRVVIEHDVDDEPWGTW